MFKEIKPKSEILKEYILSYNLLTEGSQFPFSYFAFPHTYNILTFFNHANIETGQNELTLSSNINQVFQIVVLGRYVLPLKIKYIDFVPEISINFKPIAINHFFDIPFNAFATKNIQKIDVSDWLSISKKIFIADADKTIALLEEFLLSKMKIKPLQQLQNAIEILEEDDTIEISELAKRTNQTERTLSRYFKLYAGCSPSVYKRISRFRKSIDLKYLNNKNLNCTDICFSNSFYDTAHFRKEFRRLTNQNPKEFFDTLSLVGEGHYPLSSFKDCLICTTGIIS